MKKTLLALALLISTCFALPTLTIGVLSYGTVNWELNVLKHHKLDEKNGFNLKVVKLGSKNATTIALRGKEVDAIVADWIWASVERDKKHPYVFYPYSKSTGALYVSKDTKAKDLKDLKGKKIGIAGGPVDKTWLIFRAYTKQKYNLDFKDIVAPTFASPVILNKQMSSGKLDGVSNFWHFNAKLKAGGATRLIGMHEILPTFGVKGDLPLIGWVFDESFAKKNKKLVNGFLQASFMSKKILSSDKKEWERIRPAMKAKDDKVFASLKEGYLAGIPKTFGKQEKKNAKIVFDILVKEGGKKLVGSSTALNKGTFWDFTPSVSW